MKRFQFRLEKVKKVKESREKQKAQELARQMRALELENNRLQNLLKKRTEAFLELDEAQEGSLYSNEILTYCSYINMLNQDIEQQREKIFGIQQNIGRIQLELLEASKGKKILEKLREHQYLQELLEGYREDQTLLDEMSLITRKFREML
ncbi:flagellar export protein FliJ [bacterium]|nr:flagellar export protein FliJ [bacterium]